MTCSVGGMGRDKLTYQRYPVKGSWAFEKKKKKKEKKMEKTL